MHHHLCLFIHCHPLGVIVFLTRLRNQLVERRIAPLGRVRTAVGRYAGKQRAKEVIRIAIGRSPAHQCRLMLAIFYPLQIFAPLEGDNFGLHANLRPVGLDHLRHALGIRVVGPLYRHRPQIYRKALPQPCLLQ
ncbi:hypothetical protein D3C71_1624010 [compost metagenome]